MAPFPTRTVPGSGDDTAARVAQFRQAMGHFPTGVVVVSAMRGGEPCGMSVSSFTSVSLEPLLVMFCAGRSSETWAAMGSVGRFAVSVLSAGQEDLCRLFATRGADRFAGASWSLNGSGQPTIDGAVAWFDCVVADVFPAGDHEIVVGSVLEVGRPADRAPLVFHRGGFLSLPV